MFYMHVSIYFFFLFKIAYYGIFMIDWFSFFFSIAPDLTQAFFCQDELDVRKGLLQVLKEANAFLSRLIHLAVTGRICTNKMKLVFVLGLASSEETPGSRCSQVCGGKTWVRARLLQKLWFGRPWALSHRRLRLCDLSVSPFGERFEPAR